MEPDSPPRQQRVALVTSGFDLGGGVPTIARWLRDALRDTSGFQVVVHDLATSSRDQLSRRLLKPRSFARSTLRRQSTKDDQLVAWGANAVEVEFMRYWPRRELTAALNDYDLVQVVAGSPALALVARKVEVPVVVWLASVVEWERQRHLAEQAGPMRLWRLAMTRISSRIEVAALRRADAVLALNSNLAEHLGEAGIQAATAMPGVDTRLFCPAESGWSRSGHLLSVCRLNDPRKGLERMISAYGHIVAANEAGPPLVLAGWGELPAALVEKIRRLDLESRITIRPNVDPAALPELYRRASVFVQASYEEGLGVSALEAMACGIPVVSTDTAGSRETVADGVTGLLVPQDPGSEVSRAIAGRVLEVLGGSGAELGAQARERCLRRFSSAVALQRFTDTYDRVREAASDRVPVREATSS